MTGRAGGGAGGGQQVNTLQHGGGQVLLAVRIHGGDLRWRRADGRWLRRRARKDGDGVHAEGATAAMRRGGGGDAQGWRRGLLSFCTVLYMYRVYAYTQYSC
jgi:hypothetical protein